MTDIPELKKCPFCGSDAEKGIGYNYWKFSCSNEFCELYRVYFMHDKWNTRA